MESKDDSVFSGVIEVLEKTKHLHTLSTSECITVATLVSAVVHSNRILRAVFYQEAAKVAKMMNEKQEEQHKEIGDILRKYRDIWGSEGLDEDVCKMLDKEDAANVPKDDEVLKKKVSN